MFLLLKKENISYMKLILKEDFVKIPEKDGKYINKFIWRIKMSNLFSTVKISIKARKVTVKGPKGEITKDFSHMPIDIRILKLSSKKQ